MYVITFAPDNEYLLYLNGARTSYPEQAMRFNDHSEALGVSLSHPGSSVGVLKMKIQYSVEVL